VCSNPRLLDEEIYEIWNVMKEDFASFNINITTNRDVYDAVSVDKSQMLIVTNTKTWQTLSNTGIGRYWSFKRNDTPCFAFPIGFSGWGNYEMLGEVCSHEVGHTLGLKHDGSASMDYYRGHGNWAPIMGSGYRKNITEWSIGKYLNTDNTEDDLSKITINNKGVIEEVDDIDGFYFNTQGGQLELVFEGA
jgi:hypothetical protein